jgi:phospholipid/cholesterol/gamma-HCH transport system substrate-binding protein
VAARLDGLIAKNEESLGAFAGDGLVEFTRFIEEARQLVASSSRLIENLESDPTRFLLGGQKGGVEVK